MRGFTKVEVLTLVGIMAMLAALVSVLMPQPVVHVEIKEVTVAAPEGKYAVQTGTSFAAPAVTGICALLLGAYPDLSPYEVKSALKALAGV